METSLLIISFLMIPFVILAQTIAIPRTFIESLKSHDRMGNPGGFIYYPSMNCSGYSTPGSWACFRLAVFYYDSVVKEDLSLSVKQPKAKQRQTIKQPGLDGKQEQCGRQNMKKMKEAASE